MSLRFPNKEKKYPVIIKQIWNCSIINCKVFKLQKFIELFLYLIGFEEAVLRKLNSILAKLTILDNRMTRMESQRPMGKVSNEDLDELEDEIFLPIKSMAQLDEIEQKLKSRAFLEKMVSCILQLFDIIYNIKYSIEFKLQIIF